MEVNPKLLVIGSVWPEPNSSAAGSHMMQIIEQFQTRNWEVHYASSAAPSEFAVDLKSMHISSTQIKINDSGFDEFVKALQPAVVIFDRFMVEEQFGWRVAESCPDALRIIETVDMHFLRQARQKNQNPSIAELFSDTAKREIAAIYRCDLSLIISSFEMELLTQTFNVPQSLLIELPFLLNGMDENIIHQLPNFSARTDFVTIGNFLHEPNYRSVLHLKETIWPLIRKELPQAKLYIYGAYPSQKVFQLHNEKEGFIIKGRADDALEVIQQARVFLAPITFGAGQKGKLIDAMMAGTPSVTTSIGAESMHGDLPWNGCIENDFELFAKKAVKLYNDQAQWEQAVKNGIHIINTIFDKNIYGSSLMKRINELLENKEAHRLNNFTGAMLMHHTISGTKYMSKWIEEKNRG